MRDRQLSEPALQELLAAPLTYPEVGASLSDMPSGYRVVHRRSRIGSGAECFTEASNTVLGWEMHRRAGLTVEASHSRVVEGAVAVLRLGIGVLGVRAPVRVIGVVGEPRRRGFAYGTLPGHPETGEEMFLVEHHDDDEVTLTIRAFSRAASWSARLGGPVTWAVQSWMTTRYLRAVNGP